jgi:protein-L-isoaspartate(D-aspartate) O-methyltransferase
MFFSRGSMEERRARMVERQLRDRGIQCARVLEAMGEIPRERFLPQGMEPSAYLDQAVPLAQGQTISQPYMVAVMTEALALEETHRVLEVGTGSGYQTAILARLASQVFSIERLSALSQKAESILEELNCQNVRLQVGDGSLGWEEESPFDRILVTAGAPTVPKSLQVQLDPDGGRLVIPVGDRYIQSLLTVQRHGEEYTTEELLRCRFVPLLGGEGWDST